MTNNIIIRSDCRNDSCTEPTKKLTGWGSYAGTPAIERIMQGKSKHFNTYTCDKYKNGICKGDYIKIGNEFAVEDPNGELYKSIKNATNNNYRKLHHMPLLRGVAKKNLRDYKVKTFNPVLK